MTQVWAQWEETVEKEENHKIFDLGREVKNRNQRNILEDSELKIPNPCLILRRVLAQIRMTLFKA